MRLDVAGVAEAPGVLAPAAPEMRRMHHLYSPEQISFVLQRERCASGSASPRVFAGDFPHGIGLRPVLALSQLAKIVLAHARATDEVGITTKHQSAWFFPIPMQRLVEVRAVRVRFCQAAGFDAGVRGLHVSEPGFRKRKNTTITTARKQNGHNGNGHSGNGHNGNGHNGAQRPRTQWSSPRRHSTMAIGAGDGSDGFRALARISADGNSGAADGGVACQAAAVVEACA